MDVVLDESPEDFRCLSDFGEQLDESITMVATTINNKGYEYCGSFK